MKSKLESIFASVLTPNKEKRKNMKAWDIYLDDKLVDTVFCDKNLSAWHVRRSLVYHDGYPGNVKIKEAQ